MLTARRSIRSSKGAYPMFRLLSRFCWISALLIFTACGTSATEELASARPTVNAAPSTAAPTVAQEAPPTEPTIAPTEAPTEVPTPSPEPAREAVVVQSGFGQDGQALGFGVVIDNPNPAAALEDISVQVVAYGAGDVVLGTDDSTLPMVAPAVQTYFGGDMYLDVEQPVERIEVQITGGGTPQPATPDELPPFSVEAATFRETGFSQHVSAVIRNPFTVPLTDLYVGIVLFDEADQVIGGGFTFLPFLLPEGATPFDTSVKSNGVPARVEVSPLVSNLTRFAQRSADDLPELTLVEQGWGVDRQIGYGIVVENPDQTRALERSQYLVAAYAEDGRVIAVDSGYFGLILPGQRTATGGVIYLSSESDTPAHVEALIFPGRTTEVEGKQAFSFTNATFLPGQFGAKVTAQISNPYGEPVQNVSINAILRNAEGIIIGGGSSFSERIPANGTAAMEVTVAVDGDVAAVELFAAESSITRFGE
jgi:hypothetical protein